MVEYAAKPFSPKHGSIAHAVAGRLDDDAIEALMRPLGAVEALLADEALDEGAEVGAPRRQRHLQENNPL